MANISNNMIISKTGLSQVSRELIDQRVYKNGTITIVGSPKVVNNLATGLSPDSFFQQNISFDEKFRSIALKFSGTFVAQNDTENCAWELHSDSLLTQNLSLKVKNSSVSLYYGNSLITSFTELFNNINNEIEFSIIINRKEEVNEDTEEVTVIEEYSAFLNWNNNTFTKTGYLEEVINFSSYSLITLGISSEGNSDYWEGNIYMPAFAVYQNNTLIFTPSVKNQFIFNKIMIGDGAYKLEDNSVPILNHVYSFPLTEITRTNNNVLLTTTINEEAYLTISELALYYDDEAGTHIFSLISGLNVKKGRDVGYNLIIHVKLDLNVVNTVAFPEIIVKDKDYTNFSSFTTVKQVYSYVTENLERMIKLNAMGIGQYVNGTTIDKNNQTFTPTRPYGVSGTEGSMTDRKPVGVGYNKAQVLYRAQNNLSQYVDDFIATHCYAKTKQKFTPFSTSTFNTDSIDTFGDVSVKSNGLISLFAVPNYVRAKNSPDISGSWNMQIVFNTSSDIETQQAITCFTGTSSTNPFYLSISNGYCNLQINDNDLLSVTDENDNVFYYERYGSEVEYESELYYGWNIKFTRNNASPEFEKIYTKSYENITPSTQVYNSDYEVTTLTVNDLSSQPIISSNVFPIEENSSYKFFLSYNLGEYKVKYSKDNLDFIESYTFMSPKTIGYFDTTYYGVLENGGLISTPFYGSIDLYNTNFNVISYENGQKEVITTNYLTTTFTNLSLLDYFHIPEYSHSYFLVNNLGTPEKSNLKIYEGTLQGFYDRISFNNSNGDTLCMKVYLQNIKPKTIIAKGNMATEDYYFILKQLTNALTFTIYYSNTVITLQKEFDVTNIRSFVENPITITVTYNGDEYSPEFKLYRNNELIDSVTSETQLTQPSIANMYLTDRLTLEDEPETEERVISDILFFDGCLGEDDIYYINNILDTNF